MTPNHFRQLYNYHFTINHKIWDQSISQLTEAQFKQKLPYSVGSIRNQVVHLMSVEERWFAGLRQVEVPAFINPVHIPKREKIRVRWDGIEDDMRGYLDGLGEVDLDLPYFDSGIQIWQVLFHVLNHATDHRAQLLNMLDQFDVPTFPQDYAFFVMGRM